MNSKSGVHDFHPIIKNSIHLAISFHASWFIVKGGVAHKEQNSI